MRQILCPVDFSELSAVALRYGAALAKCREARITVLYADAFQPPPYFTPGQVDQLQRFYAESRRQAETALRQFAAAALGAQAPPFETMVISAAPVEAIRRAAADTSADLIAMGTHGRSGLSRWMMGSVAERVLRESDVPVLTVRGDERPIRSILCPVNDSAAARQSLALASELARCFGATLTLLHVRETGAKHAIGDLCAWVPEAERIGCDIREVTREGEAAHEILALASEAGCDLLVMGARRRLFFDGAIIGATTARVARLAPCPVLTLIAGEESEAGTRESEAQHAV